MTSHTSSAAWWNMDVHVYKDNTELGGDRELFKTVKVTPFYDIVPYVQPLLSEMDLEWSDVRCYLKVPMEGAALYEILPDSKRMFFDLLGYTIDIKVINHQRVSTPEPKPAPKPAPKPRKRKRVTQQVLEGWRHNCGCQDPEVSIETCTCEEYRDFLEWEEKCTCCVMWDRYCKCGAKKPCV